LILVDSDVLIAHLRGRPEAHAWLREARSGGGKLSVSIVTLVEITGAMRSHERGEVWRLLSSLRALAATEAIGYRAGEFMGAFRRSHQGIGLGDYLIAATADHHDLELATLNVRHFPMFPALEAPFVIAR